VQHILLRFFTGVIEKFSAADLSIGEAVKDQLVSMTPGQLLHVRDAARDLIRIVELEVQRQLPDDDAARLLTTTVPATRLAAIQRTPRRPDAGYCDGTLDDAERRVTHPHEYLP
jgi:hypothetical protein